MAVEFQIREAVLAQAITENLQGRLFTMCLPDNIPGIHVDHLDSVPGSLNFTDLANGNIEIRIKVDLYIVLDVDLMARANASPAGATQAFGQMDIIVEIGMLGSPVLQIASAISDPAGLPPPPLLRAAAKAVVDAALQPLVGLALFDTSPIVTALRTVVPGTLDLVRGSGILGMRFGNAGPLVPQLAPEQAFGVFLDGNDATGLLSSRLPPGLPINVRWLPNGSTPAIGMDFNFELSPLDIDIASITATATGEVSLDLPATLRLSVSWTLDLGGVIGLLEPLARKLVRNFIREQINSTLPQAVHDGAQSFFFTIDLPALPPFLGARPRWGSISSSPAGMTIGGPVLPAPLGGREIVRTWVNRFGRPTFTGRCRERARVGDGLPPTEFAESQLSLHGGAGMADAGALCSAEVLAPNQWLMANTTPSLTGMGFTLTVKNAERITADVRMILRTARGIRLLNIGKPNIVRDEEGKIANVQMNWLPDCLMQSGARLKLSTGEALTVDDFKPRPLEEPDWRTDLKAEWGLNSQIVTISGLEPGEMVELLGAGIRIDLTANSMGVAMVPALVGLSGTMGEAFVRRLSGRDFAGAIRVQTQEFNWLATIGPASAAAVSDTHGHARISRQVGDSVIVEDYLPEEIEPLVRVDMQDETFLNPQPLPPKSLEALLLAERAGLQDVEEALFPPGADRGSLAIVRMRDGSGLIVSSDDGRPRVAGRYRAPIVGMVLDGGFAVASSGGLLHLFSVYQPQDVTFNYGILERN